MIKKSQKKKRKNMERECDNDMSVIQ
jgi:hypothetical protein